MKTLDQKIDQIVDAENLIDRLAWNAFILEVEGSICETPFSALDNSLRSHQTYPAELQKEMFVPQRYGTYNQHRETRIPA